MSEKLENSNALVNTVANITINNVIYELNIATTSDEQVNPNRITHKTVLGSRKNGILHEEVPVLYPLKDPRIFVNNQLALLVRTGVVQAPQALKLSVVQEIITDAASNNTGENRTIFQVYRTGIDRTIPFPSGISGTSTPAPSEICGTSAVLPSCSL